MQLYEESLFHNALEIQDPHARAEYLAHACRGNEELRRRIERLIKMFFKGEVLEPTEGVEQHPSLPLPVREQTGESIGPYKLLEKLGEGGMGIVYMAEQLQPIRRKVALKIVKAGMDTGQVVARFEAERQALAMMNHPNIAKVLDAGATDLGRPYFVMELVRGIPITEYCNEQKLNLRDRLQLFVSVCEAVHHAHQKGIIHRDIKPTNLLVELHDVKAVPKVIDFGIAKATHQTLTDRTLFTNFAQVIGTPMYMSPEQARQSGLDIDIRSDIYSLGVLLFELLTGTTPFTKETLSKVGYDEWRRIIQEEEPVRPSARISTLKAEALSTLATNQRSDVFKVKHHLRGELDWLVAKALEKDRTRRYQSALEFGDDINRFLNGEPIEAHPPSLAYRLSKIARRHRVAMIIAAALLLVLYSATGISIRYGIVADIASRNAEARRQDADGQRSIADKEREQAEQQRRKAETQRIVAERLQFEAEQQREVLRKNLYVADMRLSASDLKSENITRLQKKLLENTPATGAVDYRRWEWYYLQAAGRSSEKTLYGHTSQIENVAWSPDGKYIVSVGFDGVVIWRASSRALERRNSEGHTVKRGATWSPNSKQLAWGSTADESSIRIWNFETDEKYLLHGHTKSLLSLAWSPDGNRIASSSIDSTCKIWDTATKKCVKTLDHKSGNVTGIAWHPDGKFIATSNSNYGIRVWDLVDGEPIPDVELLPGCRSLAITANGAFLIVGDYIGQCYVFDTHTWKIATTFMAHMGECQSVAVFGDTKFATSGSDGVVKVWSFPDCKNLANLYGHVSEVSSVSWDPLGESLASCSKDKSVKIWALSNQPHFKHISFEPRNTLVDAKLKDSSQSELLLQSPDRMILDLNSLTLKNDESKASVFDMRAVSQETDLQALVGIANVELKKQQVASSNESMRLVTEKIRAMPSGLVVWSPDQTRVAFFSGGTIQVWNILTQERIAKWEVSSGSGNLDWASDSRKLGFAGAGMESDGAVLAHAGWVYIYDCDTGRVTIRMRHGNLRAPATAVEWDPLGKRIASGGVSGDVFCWDAQTGNRISSGQILRSKITHLAWSPDQSRIAVAGENSQIKIIDPQSCEEMLELKDANSGLTWLAWSVDGQKLVGIDKDGSVLVWNAADAYMYVNSDDAKFEIPLRKAEDLIEQAKFPDAIPFLDQCLNERPDSLIAMSLRSRVCNLRLRNIEAMIADLERMVQIDSENVVYLLSLADCLSLTNRNSEAVALYTKGLDRIEFKYEGRMRFLTGRALGNARLGKVSEAKQDLLAVIEQYKEHIEQDKLLALLHLQMGEREAYAALCERVMKEATLSASGEFILKVVSLCHLGDNALDNYEKAIELLQTRFKRDGTYMGPPATLGAMLFRAGEYEAAIATLMTIKEGHQDTLKFFFLAMSHQKVGNYDKASDLLEQANAAATKLLSNPGLDSWDVRTEIELYRRQATQMIHGER